MAKRKEKAEPAKAEPVKAEPAGMVPGPLAAAAAALWEKGHNTYWREGGVSDLRGKLESLNTGDDSLSQGFLLLGRQCIEFAGGDLKQASVYFSGACAQTEKAAKQGAVERKEKDTSIVKLLPTWSPNKATISKALDKSVNLCAKDDKGNLLYPTITPVRAAIRTQRKPQTEPTAVPEFDYTAKLKAALHAFTKEAAACNIAGQDALADSLIDLIPVIQNKFREYKPDAVNAEPGIPAADKKARAMRGGTR